MQKDIHPKYNSACKVQCACGAVFEVGSTKEFIETEVCNNCHPFYTGKEKIIDTTGRVEKFKQKMAKRQVVAKKKKVKKVSKNKKQL